MRILPRRLGFSSEGVAATEFALVAPFLVILMMGIFQLGILFMARAGLGQAVESGARYATIHPSPTDAQIKTKVLASGYGMDTDNIVQPTVAHGTTNGSPYVDVTMGYNIVLDFGFYKLDPIQLSYTRRAYQV
jgi:Flp pilus assembly protein TadG